MYHGQGQDQDHNHHQIHHDPNHLIHKVHQVHIHIHIHDHHLIRVLHVRMVAHNLVHILVDHQDHDQNLKDKNHQRIKQKDCHVILVVQRNLTNLINIDISRVIHMIQDIQRIQNIQDDLNNPNVQNNQRILDPNIVIQNKQKIMKEVIVIVIVVMIHQNIKKEKKKKENNDHVVIIEIVVEIAVIMILIHKHWHHHDHHHFPKINITNQMQNMKKQMNLIGEELHHQVRAQTDQCHTQNHGLNIVVI